MGPSLAGHVGRDMLLKQGALRPCIVEWTSKTWLSYQVSKAVLMHLSHTRNCACQDLLLDIRHQTSSCALELRRTMDAMAANVPASLC